MDTPELLLLRPGRYTAVYESHRGLYTFMKVPKLVVMFRLIDHAELVLPRWYRVTGFRGRVSAPAHSDLVREISAVLLQRVRHDRIPISSLANVPVYITAKTVTEDAKQRPLAEVNQYSVIESLDGRA